jgi:hypothetical protein
MSSYIKNVNYVVLDIPEKGQNADKKSGIKGEKNEAVGYSFKSVIRTVHRL